jgi:AraC-like DNA-binding protein
VFSYDFDTYVAVILVDGVEEFETPSMRCRWRPGDGAIFNPGECFNRTAVTDCAHLTLRLRPGAVDEYLSDVLSRRPAQPLRFDSPVVGGSRRGSAVARTLEFAAAQLSDVSAEEAAGVVGDLERLLLDTLLFLQPNNQSQRISAQRPSVGPAYLAAVEQYIQAHCGENLTLELLAAQAGVGVRALNAAFRRHRGTSPMQYLKSARLARVRRELEAAGPGARVADIATRWGFYQLGWFAAEYRKVYGELPSETLRRCATERRHNL